jgi:hypothetical protein
MSEFDDRWNQLLSDLYTEPNDLRVGRLQELDDWLSLVRATVLRDPSLPVIVPFRLGNRSGYYAVAADRAQARVLRTYLAAAVGPPWSTFEGASLREMPHHSVLDAAVTSFAGGDTSRVFAFDVPTNSRAAARASLRSLLERLATSPGRSVDLRQPIGRLVGEFNDASSTGRRRAAELVLQRLQGDHRLTARNRLFLEVEFLAAFEEWEQLGGLIETSELLHLQRPLLVSDALARFVMHTRVRDGDADEFARIAPTFGALVPTTGAIRSSEGAEYYFLWAVACGEDAADVAARIKASGWFVASTTFSPAESKPTDTETTEYSSAHALLAVEQGRLDTAVAILSQLNPDPALFGVVIELVVTTRSSAAIALLDLYRSRCGDPAVGQRSVQVVLDAPQTMVEAFGHLADPAEPTTRRDSSRSWLVEFSPQHAATGGLVAVTRFIRDLLDGAGSADFASVIDAALDVATACRRSSVNADGFSDFGMAVLELWAFSSDEEQRDRMERVVDLAFDALAHGVSEKRFEEIVEYLRSCWSPFLADKHCGLGIETIEGLLSYSTAGSSPVLPFALPILSRIGPHNARRIERSVLEVARALADECGLELGHLESDVDVAALGEVPAAKVLIYSLIASASVRAAGVLKSRYPQLSIETCDDLVASDRLRQQVRRSDIVLITDRAAKHPVTDAIRVEMGGRDPVFAMGRGSSSIIDAVEVALQTLAAAN